LEAYGTIDELNSHIGLLTEEVVNKEDKAFLQHVQSLLFVVGCELATEQEKESPHKLLESDIDKLEKEIDKTDAVLPKLSGFVMQGGSRCAAISHICRTVCRRAERCICELNAVEAVESNVLIYINRLSDYFFVLARKLCLAEKKEEIFWHKPCK